MYRIILSDNSTGLEQEYAETIFETFRLNPADEYEGPGLRLELCKLVERHKCSFAASVDLAKGAKLVILLLVE